MSARKPCLIGRYRNSGRAWPVLITSASGAITALPVGRMTEAMLVDFRLLSRPVRRFFLVTARRAFAIAENADV